MPSPDEIRCVACKGVWHPASGDWNPRFQVATCGRCHRDFWEWFNRHQKRLWRVAMEPTPTQLFHGLKVKFLEFNFYEAAVTSNRPPG